MTQKEFRFKSGSKILSLISRFSATEKAAFGLLSIALITSAFVMVVRVSDIFKIEVPARGGELREGVIGLPRTINPILAITDVDRDLSSLVYSGLMRYDGGSVVPDLAKSYTVSKDGLIYDFKLRDDIKFHDGTTLTADDVEFTVKKLQDPVLKSPRRADWVNVTVRKISQNEIQFVLKQAYSPFIINTTVGIIPKHIWEKVTNDQFIFSQYNLQPIGSGPYRYDSTTYDSEGIPTTYKLKSSSNYYNKKPYITNLTFHLFADLDKALSAIDTGIVDSLSSVPAVIASKLATNSAEAYTIIKSPLPRIFGVFLNQTQSAVLADKTVRQALSVAVDRNAVINDVLFGYGEPLDGPLPTWFKDSATSSISEKGKIGSSSLDYARYLLEKNGWKKGNDGLYFKKSAKSATTTISFSLYTADSEDLKQTAQFLKNTWSKLGADVQMKTFNSSDLYQNVIKTRKYDALLFGEQVGKDRDLYAFWHSSQRNSPGLNISMYANSKIDKILENMRSTNDEMERQKDYVDLDQQIRADMPAIFLYSPSFTYVIPKRLKGVKLDSISVSSDRWNNINNWYLETEKIWKIFTNSK